MIHCLLLPPAALFALSNIVRRLFSVFVKIRPVFAIVNKFDKTQANVHGMDQNGDDDDPVAVHPLRSLVSSAVVPE